MILDAITIVAIVTLLLLSRNRTESGWLLWIGGLVLLLTGALDFYLNSSVYFPQGPATTTDGARAAARQRVTTYMAGPLFTSAEWRWNKELARDLRSAGLDVVSPQERAQPMLLGEEPFSPDKLFAANTEALDTVDTVIANLDGADSDSGTSWECGYAFKRGIPVIGIRTDLRTSGDLGSSVNLMLVKGCFDIIVVPADRRDDPHWIESRILESVRAALAPKIKPPKA